MNMREEVRRWIRQMKRKARADGKALRYKIEQGKGGSYSIFLDIEADAAGRSTANRKQKVLDRLRQQQGKDEMEKLQLQVLEKVIESGFSSNAIGTMVDQFGVKFGYIFLQSAYFPELSGELLTGVLVMRLQETEAGFVKYARKQLEHVEVLDEEQKEVCLSNIEAAMILRENESIRKGLEH